MATTAVAKQGGKELASYVKDHADAIADVTPSHVKAEAITRTLMAAVQAEPKLGLCTKSSLVDCLRKACLTGLRVGTGQGDAMAQAHVIPYGETAQFQINYKGYKELVRRSGQGTVVMDAVHEGDAFEPRGVFALPSHIPSKKPNRRYEAVTHAYAAFLPNQGAPIVSVWTREECMKHRDHYSKGFRSSDKDSPWHEDNPAFRVMCMKTALLDLVNRGDVPLSAEVQQMARDEMHNYVDAVQAPVAELPTTDDDQAAIAAAETVTEQTPPADPGELPTDNDIAEMMAEADDPDALGCQLMEKYPQIDGDIASAVKQEVRKRNAAAEA